jgi:hypothetical protein
MVWWEIMSKLFELESVKDGEVFIILTQALQSTL